MRKQVYIPSFDQYNGGPRFIHEDSVYKKSTLLGSGLYGEVYKFIPDDRTKTPVVVKFEIPNSVTHRYDQGKTFQREAMWNHEIHGLGLLSGDTNNRTKPHYLLMPFFEGKNFEKRNYRNISEVLFFWIKIALALKSFHDTHQAVHGDFKPSNVVFEIFRQVVVLVDFGLTAKKGAKHLLINFTAKELKVCPQIAPEIVFHQSLTAQPEQDVYGLGACLARFYLYNRSVGWDNSKGHWTDLLPLILGLHQNDPKIRWTIPQAVECAENLRTWVERPPPVKEKPKPVATNHGLFKKAPPHHLPPLVKQQQRAKPLCHPIWRR